MEIKREKERVRERESVRPKVRVRETEREPIQKANGKCISDRTAVTGREIRQSRRDGDRETETA